MDAGTASRKKKNRTRKSWIGLKEARDLNMSLRPVNVHKFLEKIKRRAGNWGTQVNARKLALKKPFHGRWKFSHTSTCLEIYATVEIHLADTRHFKNGENATLIQKDIQHVFWVDTFPIACNKQCFHWLTFYFLPFLVHFLLFPNRKLVFQLDPIRLGSYEPWFPLLRHQLFHGTVFPGGTGTKCKYHLNDMLLKLKLPSKESRISRFDIFFNV